MSEGTTPKFAENAKYADWFKEYNFGNCKLNREEYTRFLANYITSEQDGFVLNLNGSWGTGKTHFLKRLYTHLLQDRGHPTIYIDAWESDFIQNPLAVISSELLNQLSRFSQISGKDFQIVKDRLGTLLRSSMIGLAAVASKSLVGDSTAGAEFAKEMMSKTPSNFLDDIQKDTTAQVAAIPEIRKSLTAIAEVIKTNTNGKAELPVVVLIDELDRCRPNYSIELLEVVKHFFNTEKFVFVIASDTEQLQRSIKTIYGAEFESDKYLKRFFDRQSSLQEPNIRIFLEANYTKKSSKENEALSHTLYPSLDQHRIGIANETAIYEQLELISKIYSLKLRDLEQIIYRYQACMSSFEKSFIVSPTVLLTYLANQHTTDRPTSQTLPSQSETKDSVSLKQFKEVYDVAVKSLHSNKEELNRVMVNITGSIESDRYKVANHLNKWLGQKLNNQSLYQNALDQHYRSVVELSGTLTGMDTE